MTERQLQLRIGAFVLTAIFLFVAFVLSIGSRSALFQQRYSLSTSFSTTEGLVEGSPVRLAGVAVGNVTRIGFSPTLSNRRIQVTLSIERRVQDRIRQDSVASIGTIGLVGDKVLDITVGSSDLPVVPPGGALESVNPMDYSALLQKGNTILDHVTRISASLDEFLSGGGKAEGQNLSEAVRSLRTTLVEVEKGQGLLHDIIYGPEGANLLVRMDRTMQSLERVAHAMETERGLLHALIYNPPDQTLGRLTQTLADVDDLVREAREGHGLLHALLYDPQRAEILTHLEQASQQLEALTQAARTGKGLLPTLLFDPEGAKTLGDVQGAVTDVRAAAVDVKRAASDLQAIAEQLRQGQGTLGALLEDPTVYEDLSALLRGAQRSFLLRSLIRATRDEGAQKSP